jgi:predicted dehydrogenase
MASGLRAVVVGAGWAGEGHTRALQSCGVEVVAICARQPAAVQAAADRLGVRHASTDWRETIAGVKPDIVTLATPATLRREVVALAVGLGCHLLSEKPLAVDAVEAEAVYRLAQGAGVKHAYAATHRYDPSVAWLVELLRSAVIGPLQHISYTVQASHTGPLTPWSWADSLALGGGSLNNAFPHMLGILATLGGGQLVRAVGEARVLRRRAPVVPELHDFRQRGSRTPTPAEAERLEWLPCDADRAFTALLEFAAPDGPLPATVILNQGVAVADPANGLRLTGADGTLLASGVFSFAVSRLRPGQPPEPLPVPQRLLDAVPQVGDEFQNKWCALARDFVASIEGAPHPPYLTFRDGWRYQAAIDAIRAGTGWCPLPG